MIAVSPASWDALAQDFAQFTDVGRLVHVAVRLLVAAILGGVLGFQREKTGKAAGLRTHILVAVGAAFFIITPQQAGLPLSNMAHVIQGVITGIGFIGAGAILKMQDEKQIRGLTTAAGIWLTAAVGLAAGFGQLALALIAAVLAFLIFEVLYRLEQKLGNDSEAA